MLFLHLLLVILIPHWGHAETVQSDAGSGDAPVSAGNITIDTFTAGSPQCAGAQQTPKALDTIALIGSRFQTQMLAKASEFYLEQSYFLRSKGVLGDAQFNAQKGDVTQTAASCSKFPFQKSTMDTFTSKVNGQKVSSDNSSDDILYQKRYLMAYVETYRLIITVGAAQTTKQERDQAVARLGKLSKYYPLTQISYANSNNQMPAIDFGPGYRNPLYSQKTHDHIDDFLFPDSSGNFKTVASATDLNDYNFAAKFVNDMLAPGPLPPNLKTALSNLTAGALNPVLKAQQNLCALDACPTLAIAPTALAETLNSMSGADQTNALQAVCLCEFGKKTKFVNDTAMGITGGSALGFGALCVVTGGWGCAGAVVMGVITAGASGANTYGSISDLMTNAQMTNVASNLPSTTPGDLAQLRAYQNSVVGDLGLSVAGTVAGEGVAAGAGYLLKGQGPKIASFLKKYFAQDKPASAVAADLPAVHAPAFSNAPTVPLPAGAVSVGSVPTGNVMAVTGADGKISYFLKSATGGAQPLAMDPTGYALAVGGQSRQILDAAVTSGKSVVLLDANHLGLVNYMPHGLAGGDAYLKAIARIAHDQTGGQALIARYGGDEYAIVTSITDPVQLQRLTQNISDAVMRDPAAREVFLAQKQLNKYVYHSLRNATSYDQLPTSVKATLSPDEATYAQSHWSSFRTNAMAVTNKAIYDSAAIQPSLSAGSAIVGSRNSTEAFSAANKALNDVKMCYKGQLGLDTAKYCGRASFIPPEVQMQKPRQLDAKPVTLPPY